MNTRVRRPTHPTLANRSFEKSTACNERNIKMSFWSSTNYAMAKWLTCVVY